MGFVLRASRLGSIGLTSIFAFILAALPAVAQQVQENLPPTTKLSISESKTPPLGNSDSIEPRHDFLDKTNILLFSGMAIFRVLDYTSTRNMLARGREERLIPDDVVYSNAGFASLEAAGAAASIGVSYLLHRTGHHKLERWMSIGHISVTAFGAARNYALESKHP